MSRQDLAVSPNAKWRHSCRGTSSQMPTASRVELGRFRHWRPRRTAGGKRCRPLPWASCSSTGPSSSSKTAEARRKHSRTAVASCRGAPLTSNWSKLGPTASVVPCRRPLSSPLQSGSRQRAAGGQRRQQELQIWATSFHKRMTISEPTAVRLSTRTQPGRMGHSRTIASSSSNPQATALGRCRRHCNAVRTCLCQLGVGVGTGTAAVVG